ERCVAVRLQLDRAAGFFENGELSFADRRGRPQFTFIDGEPRDGVPFGRRVAPVLAIFKSHVKIVDVCRCANNAAGLTTASKNHAHGSVFLHCIRSDVLTFRGSVLLRRRQCHPQLEDAQGLARRGPTVMPYAVSGLHPLESTGRDRALLSGRVLIDHASAKYHSERYDAGVWVDAEERLGSRRDFGMIQEYERLDQLADIGGADEASDGPVPAPA